LQSQACLFAKNRFMINALTFVHGRLNTSAMADHTARRAREYRRRAAKLAETAQHVRDAGDRRHLLNLAEGYARVADQMAAVPAEPQVFPAAK
jgi:hypothetical protein